MKYTTEDYDMINNAESLTTALYHLERLEGCETQVKQLTKKLQEMFKDVPFNKRAACKRIGKIKYYPMGLCEAIALGVSVNYKIILKPYDYELAPRRKPKKKTPSLEYLKQDYPLIYCVLRKKLGLKYDVSILEKCSIIKGVEIIEHYNSLTDKTDKKQFEKAIFELYRNQFGYYTYTSGNKEKTVANLVTDEFGGFSYRIATDGYNYNADKHTISVRLVSTDVFDDLVMLYNEYIKTQPDMTFASYSESRNFESMKFDIFGKKDITLLDYYNIINENITDKESREILAEIGWLKPEDVERKETAEVIEADCKVIS
jgi:hypothetical protein